MYSTSVKARISSVSFRYLDSYNKIPASLKDSWDLGNSDAGGNVACQAACERRELQCQPLGLQSEA